MYFDGFRDMGCEEKLLVPLRQVTRPRTFNLHMNWDGEEIEDAPFQVFRPGKRESFSNLDWV
jgi:hypothetical protein